MDGYGLKPRRVMALLQETRPEVNLAPNIHPTVADEPPGEPKSVVRRTARPAVTPYLG